MVTVVRNVHMVIAKFMLLWVGMHQRSDLRPLLFCNLYDFYEVMGWFTLETAVRDDLVVVNVEEVCSLALRFYGHFPGEPGLAMFTHCSLSAVTHAPFHASVLRPASQVGPVHEATGVGEVS